MQLDWTTIIKEGGLALVAALAIVATSQVWKLLLKVKDEQLQRERDDKELMVGLVTRCTKAETHSSDVIARNSDAFEELNTTLKRLNGKLK
jgi:hypothetical protein